MRVGVAASCSCQDIWKASATRPKASRSVLDVAVGEAELDAHEEAAVAGRRTAGSADVRRLLHQEAADGVDDAGRVGAGQREDVLAAGSGSRRHAVSLVRNTQHGG